MSLARPCKLLGNLSSTLAVLVHPATLLFDEGAKFLLQRDPEPERPIAGGQLGRLGQAVTFELPQEITPGVLALAEPIDHGQQLLGAVLGRPDLECLTKPLKPPFRGGMFMDGETDSG
jgi:hypothetical protein